MSEILEGGDWIDPEREKAIEESKIAERNADLERIKKLSEGRDDENLPVVEQSDYESNRGLGNNRQHEIMQEVYRRLDKIVKPVLEDFQLRIITISDELKAKLSTGGSVTDEDIDNLELIYGQLDDYTYDGEGLDALRESFRNTDPLIELHMADMSMVNHYRQDFKDVIGRPVENYLDELKAFQKTQRVSGLGKENIPEFQVVNLENCHYGLDEKAIFIYPDDILEPIYVTLFFQRKLLEAAHITLSKELPKSEIIVENCKPLTTDFLDDLILNAMDAMPNGGEINFKLEQQGHEAVLTIMYRGDGMIEMNTEYDQILSEREKGGTGMVLGEIKRYFEDILGGKLTIECQAGKGTTITIKLPIVEQAVRDVRKT